MEANSVPVENGRIIGPVLLFAVSLTAVFVALRPSDSAELAPQAARHTFPFNHNAHLSAGLDCNDCHTGVKTGTGAVVPDAKTCSTCHDPASPPKGKSAAEAHLREMLGRSEDVIFHPISELDTAGVFFSHRRHVKVAKLECKVCHGDMKQHASPPERSTVPLDMNFCIDCHAKKSANQDCLGCHR